MRRLQKEASGRVTMSAKDSVIFSGGDSSKNYGADQQRLQISDLHFDKFPTPATFACWKIRFKTEVCTCSQFPTVAMQWIKEVELVDSVDELRSSSFPLFLFSTFFHFFPLFFLLSFFPLFPCVSLVFSSFFLPFFFFSLFS